MRFVSSRTPRRSVPLVVAVFVGGASIGAGAIVLLTSAGGTKHAVGKRILTAPPIAAATTGTPTVAQTTTRPPARPVHVRVSETTAHIVDPQRTMNVGGQQLPRSFDTVIRYPIGLPGPFPLIVFGHGYEVTPASYTDLLNAWAKAGYVVAAPVFPLENQNAPGGPNENDLRNQPEDMSLVISSLQTPSDSAAARVSGMINFSKVAVSGHSDGGDTALAVAYDQPLRDTRVKAAVILAGAEDPFAPSFSMAASGPPLLAVQGTADGINPPDQTYAFFNQAARPRYLLKMLGAGHGPPYMRPGRELAEITKVTLAFLNKYLKRRPSALSRYATSDSAGTGSTIVSDP
jgi:dienelactone hydrolase